MNHNDRDALLRDWDRYLRSKGLAETTRLAYVTHVGKPFCAVLDPLTATRRDVQGTSERWGNGSASGVG
jgi:hypothetical protein